MYKLFSLIYVSSIEINKVIGNKCIRCFHETATVKIKTRIKVNDYLLNRSIPATEILSNLSKEDNERLEEIKNQHQILLTNGKYVTKSLNDNDLLELMCLSSKQRLNYFKYLNTKEFKKEKNRAKKLEESSDTKVFPDVIYTYVGENYRKISTNLIKQRVFEAIILKSQEIVFDFSFENDMTRREILETTKQFRECYGLNRKLAEPFQIGVINCNRGSLTHCDLKRSFLPFEFSKYGDIENLPLVFHKKPLIETYPDKRMIYLSPNSLMAFEEGEYDHDAIYIISAIVDKGKKFPLSLSKANEEGVEHRSLPIDRYVNCLMGNNVLPLNHTFKMMSIARETNGDWCKAIRQSLPSRILYPKSRK